MGLTFNPLSGFFDLTGNGGGANPYYGNPVATEADLPASGSPGQMIVVKQTDHIYVWDDNLAIWVDTGLYSVDYQSTPSSPGVNMVVDEDLGILRTRLVVTPADGTHTGVVTSSAQTFGGTKTFSNVNVTSNITTTGNTYADGGVDTSTVGGTLAIGTNKATTINIGSSGATINLIGDTIYENVTNLNVKDKTITINSGGGPASASSSGVEIEEDGSITGYLETSGDRNTFLVKAPGQAGVITLSPGASGFTINQGSHNPVTITAVGSSPNGNAATLSTQALTLQPADGTNPGVLTAGTQTIGGNKTFSGTVTSSNLSGTNTGDVSITDTNSIDLTLVGQALTADVRLSGSTLAVDASGLKVSSITNTEISASAAIARSKLASGNAYRVLVNDVSGVSSEASALTNGQLLIGSTGAAPVSASLTAGAGITITPGAGSISIASNYVVPTGDIQPSSYTSSTDVASNETITGFAFANAVSGSFSAQVQVKVNATANLYANYKLEGIQRGSDWVITQDYTGDNTGVSFSITAAGQLQLSKTTTVGFTSTVIKFRATALSP